MWLQIVVFMFAQGSVVGDCQFIDSSFLLCESSLPETSFSSTKVFHKVERMEGVRWRDPPITINPNMFPVLKFLKISETDLTCGDVKRPHYVTLQIDNKECDDKTSLKEQTTHHLTTKLEKTSLKEQTTHHLTTKLEKTSSIKHKTTPESSPTSHVEMTSRSTLETSSVSTGIPADSHKSTLSTHSSTPSEIEDSEGTTDEDEAFTKTLKDTSTTNQLTNNTPPSQERYSVTSAPVTSLFVSTTMTINSPHTNTFTITPSPETLLSNTTLSHRPNDVTTGEWWKIVLYVLSASVFIITIIVICCCRLFRRTRSQRLRGWSNESIPMYERTPNFPATRRSPITTLVHEKEM